ncbi:MAG: hypothetical protein DRO40_07925 [Thermoprotei archaeon]|nr:MAG: hypothetical protein DRO40_07925 [Thermoprotei archaeon]
MEVYEVIAVISSFIIGLIVGRQYYKRFKEILHKVRICIDAVDDALADDTVTKEEVRKIVENCRRILE